MEFLFQLFIGYPIWVWLMFFFVVIALLAFDLGVLHRDQHEIGVAESLKLSAFYITLGLLFGAWLWWYQGAEAGMAYLTGYLVEKSLSMDNVFVISLIFTSLAVPRIYQHRVLFWGILGVIVMRAIMIGLGALLVAEFQWVLVLFGLFLVFTGLKMLFSNQDPFIVYTSNIFAVLGLRALYFALAAMVHRFHYLKYALAGVLVFIGIKVALVYFNGIDLISLKIPTWLSLSVTLSLLTFGVLYSLHKTRNQETPKTT